MTTDGHVSKIYWYFVPAGNPVFGKHAFGSLNWSKPDYPVGGPGEIPGAARQWRDGSRPVWLANNPTFSQRGATAQYITGLDPAIAAPVILTWAGEKNFPPGNPAGLFPPMRPPPGTPPRLQSNLRGLFALSGFDGRQWVWPIGPPPMTIFHGFAWDSLSYNPLWLCQLQSTLAIDNAGTFRPLRCTGLNPFGTVSVWDDPRWGFLMPGEVLTLTYP